MVNVLDERRITSLDWESLLQGVNENRSDHYTMQELRVVGLVSVAALINRPSQDSADFSKPRERSTSRESVKGRCWR
jgi:hypothetical protein